MLRVWARPAQPLDQEDRRLLDALARQAALAVERGRLVAAATELRLVAESDRLKSALLHGVSHDLRTPLGAIKGAVSNLLDEEVAWEPAARRSLLQTIDLEADRLNRLVRNLLDMSRIEAGGAMPVKELAALDDVLGPALHRLREHLRQHPLTVVVPPDLPLIPMALLQIDQVFTNLLENAAKYTSPGTPIWITASSDGRAVQIDLADAGPGVAADERAHIFEKFYRVGGHERAESGSGLGLTICRYWVEAHGGRLWVEPRPGGGAVFCFTLPLHDPARRTLVHPATTDRRAEPPAPQGAP